ncbi:ATP-binding protein [Hymenobacter sublimis]|uniref:ATP-binding protein n=1 Tax=Hymenobacter sublimis TaxID=2933777 RepID=A0ABY4JF00_9BACT|nr:ATP-binding protein [Hymenobacter sublimis]UPL51388.1 ATP-binding protein [Hymenobacter sublimis]
MLTERPLSRLGGRLPGTPQKIYAEIPAGGVDDIVVDTDLGQTYIQAKNTVPLSDNATGELASVAAQFVRQFRAGVLENGTRRPLVPARDRLVLAVSTGATGTIKEHLQEVLDRNRTGAATGLPANQQHALDVFTGLLDAAWLAEAGTAITAAQQQALLAVCSVIVVGSPQHQLVTEALLSIVAPGLEDTLLILLDHWAHQAARQGTGGDAAAIRLALRGRIQLTEPPSFRQDIARLHTYSAATLAELARFTTIDVVEGTITVSRPVVNDVVDAALGGSLAITGEPGAGKSAILHTAASILGQQHPVFCFKVENGPGTLDELRREIGLEHPLLEVLRQVPGDRPAFVLLDALDASRGNQAETTYKKLLREVAALPGWHVVASVRTFDLRVGKEWQQLFHGLPPMPQHADRSFGRVRHLHIGLLDAGERADLARQSPSLHTALAAGGPKMEALALNPFNLALLADLLRGGTPPESLAGVSTQGQLLDRYWQERVGDSTPVIVGLTRLVEQMLDAKALTIAQGRIDAATGTAVDEMQENGVLLLEQPRRVLGFRHHVLFDYAVACLALLPDVASARAQLVKSKGAGLLLAPSLNYWIDGLKHNSGLSTDEFWGFVGTLVADEGMDPIVRVEVARLSVETVQADEDLMGLVRVFNQGDAAATRSLRHFVVALVIKAQRHQPFQAGPWARVVAELRAGADQLGLHQTLVETLLDGNPTADALPLLSQAARQVLTSVMAAAFLNRWQVRSAIASVVRTYGTNPAASRQLLTQLLEPERFRRYGHVEIPALAEHLDLLAGQDEALAVQLVYCVFGSHEFRHDQATPMVSSFILGMQSNAAQDFELARHKVEKHFAALLAAYPRTAVRVLAAALRGARDRKEWSSPEPRVENLTVGTTSYRFEDDSSAYWAHDLETSRSDDHAEMYQRFLQWIPGVQDPALLADMPGLLLEHTSAAIVWRTLFEAGARQPQLLGRQLWAAASSPLVLQCQSTRKSTIELLQVLYPLVPAEARQEAERAWLAWGFADFTEPEWMRTSVIGTVLKTLGAQQLATDEAREFLQVAIASGEALVNSKPLEIHSTFIEREPFEAENNAGTATADSVPGLARAVHHTQQAVRAAPTEEILRHLQEALLAFDAAVSPAGALPEAEAAAVLSEGLGVLLAYAPASATSYPEALTRLLELTHHPEPFTGPDTEEDFAQSVPWGYSAARIEAAKALAHLLEISSLWPLIQDRVEELLLRDPHPTVRFVLITALYKLSWHNTEATWELAEKFAEQEINPQVINHATAVLRNLAHEDAARLEPLLLKLLTKASGPGEGSRIMVELLLRLALERQLPASQAQLREWVSAYSAHKKQLGSVMAVLRVYLSMGYDRAQDPQEDAIRQRSQVLMQELVDAVEPAVRNWTSDNHQPTEEEEEAHWIFNELAGQLFYAIGHDLPENIGTLEAKRQCLTEYAPFISRFATLGTPGTVHHMLDILLKFVAVNPTQCFDLFAEAMLRTTGVAKYEYESQGAKRFVELVEEYLADHRALFAKEDRRTKLIDCLAIFSDAGWPEAWQLFQQLPDLFR